MHYCTSALFTILKSTALNCSNVLHYSGLICTFFFSVSPKFSSYSLLRWSFTDNNLISFLIHCKNMCFPQNSVHYLALLTFFSPMLSISVSVLIAVMKPIVCSLQHWKIDKVPDSVRVKLLFTSCRVSLFFTPCILPLTHNCMATADACGVCQGTLKGSEPWPLQNSLINHSPKIN